LTKWTRIHARRLLLLLLLLVVVAQRSLRILHDLRMWWVLSQWVYIRDAPSSVTIVFV
jgi:hypothetical protein